MCDLDPNVSAIRPPFSIVGRLANHGVELNGLIIPGRAIENVLARHSVNLLVNNDDDTYRVSLVGSATAIREETDRVANTIAT